METWCNQTINGHQRSEGTTSVSYFSAIALKAAIRKAQGDEEDVEAFEALLPPGFQRPDFQRPAFTTVNFATSLSRAEAHKQLLDALNSAFPGLSIKPQTPAKDMNMTSLHWAVAQSDDAAAKEQTKHYHVDTIKPIGFTPLHVTAMMGFSSMTMLLLEHGAGIDVQEHRCGYAAVHIALILEGTNVVESLLAHGVDVDAITRHGALTPLYIASLYGHEAGAKLLIAHGAHVKKNARWWESKLPRSFI